MLLDTLSASLLGNIWVGNVSIAASQGEQALKSDLPVHESI